jgi:hypothetical protein
MSGLVAGIGARLAGSLILGKAKAVAGKGVGILTRIPKPVWEAVAVIGYLVALIALHQHYANAALKAADQAGYERRASEDAAALIELRNRAHTAETNGKAISQDERSKNDAQVADIHRTADAIRLRGPGAASSGRVDHPALPAASGEPQPAPGASGAAADPVPAADGPDPLAVVSWRWLVGTGEQCDIERAENVSWRGWYVRQSAEWAKLKGGK